MTTLVDGDLKKGSYIVENADKKRKGYVIGPSKETGKEKTHVVVSFASQVQASIAITDFAKYDKSTAWKYYLAGPGMETLANLASYFLVKKTGKALFRQSDFNMPGFKAFFIDEMIYEVGLKMWIGARADTSKGEDVEVDTTMWQTMMRPFGENIDENKAKKEDWLAAADAWDALNKVVPMFVIDKTVRAVMNREKLTVLNLGRYTDYFVTFYLANIVQRKLLGTKEQSYTHY